MSICRYCGAHTEQDQYFCNACGEPLFADDQGGPSQLRGVTTPATEQMPGRDIPSETSSENIGIAPDQRGNIVSFPEDLRFPPVDARASETATGVYFRDAADESIEVVGEASQPHHSNDMLQTEPPPQRLAAQSASIPGAAERTAGLQGSPDETAGSEQPGKDHFEPHTNEPHLKKRPVPRHSLSHQRNNMQQQTFDRMPQQPQQDLRQLQPDPTRQQTYQRQPMQQQQPLVSGQINAATAGTAAVGAPSQFPHQTPNRQGYPTREELRRMVIEKQAKRKKLLLFGIPALVVVFGATFALLFLFVFGGGMSSDEYRNQVGEKHNNVVLALKEVDQEWLWADVSEEPYSECYPTVQVCVDDAASTIAEAQAALAEIKPPQEVSALHEELAAYYGDVDAYLTRADVVLSFLTNWYAVTEKANDYSYAIDQYDGNPNVAPAEFIGWMDTDIAALNGFLQQASELEAPEECQALTQEYIAMLQDELDIMERIKRVSLSFP
jgi:hypothetical protein